MCGPLKLTAHLVRNLEANSSHKMFGNRMEEVEEEWGRGSLGPTPFTGFCRWFPK